MSDVDYGFMGIDNQPQPIKEQIKSEGMGFVTPTKEERNITTTTGNSLSELTPEEAKMVRDFASKIDLSNVNTITNYGVSAQKKIAEFSDSVLSTVKTKDTGEVGNLISDLVGQINSYDESLNNKGVLSKIFRNAKRSTQTMIAKYKDAESSIEIIETSLEKKSLVLNKDIILLENLYQQNLSFFKELSLYILAGKQHIDEVRSTTLPQLRQKAETTGSQLDAQAVRDLEEQLNRFEKRIYDLELTRQISIQTAPQIRMLQNNDAILVEKIQSSIANTIPLWKSQMIIALGISHSREAVQAQNAVAELTNRLLTNNAEQLKIGSVEVARESERGIVDIETLKNTNQMLLATMDEVMAIQEQGREARNQAEIELESIEESLKQKLLEHITGAKTGDDYGYTEESGPTLTHKN